MVYIEHLRTMFFSFLHLVTDDVSYTSLISMQEVKDDSSDFELPEHISETLEM